MIWLLSISFFKLLFCSETFLAHFTLQFRNQKTSLYCVDNFSWYLWKNEMICVYEPESIATVYQVINVREQSIKIDYSCRLIMDYAHNCTDNFVCIFQILSYIDQLKPLCKHLSWLFLTPHILLQAAPDRLSCFRKLVSHLLGVTTSPASCAVVIPVPSKFQISWASNLYLFITFASLSYN